MENKIKNIDFDFCLNLVNDDLTVDEKKHELERLIKKRDDLLHSFGYFIDINENVEQFDLNIINGIVGFAVGDALGVPVEFYQRERLKKRPLTEMIGYCNHMVPAGTWSDDTSMTLATMDSIIQKGMIDYDDIMLKFSEWITDCKYTAIGSVFDAGNTVRISISNYKCGINSINCGCKDINSNGNGSLMRILPIAYFLYYNNFTEDEEVEIINNVSSLTHAHEISCLGCKMLSDYIKQLLIGDDKVKALEHIKKKKYNKHYSDNAISYYERIFSYDISQFSRDLIRSSGYIVDTLEASLWCTLNSNNYEEAVINAVNLGGDTDTIGAITGGISGIIYGVDKIPERWLNKLKKRDYIEEIANNFAFTLNSINKNKSK